MSWRKITANQKFPDRYDVWARRYKTEHGEYEYRRFVDVFTNGFGAPAGAIERGWEPTHWMPIPPEPKP